MTAFLDEIAAIIEANTTQAGTGTSWPIFRSQLPDSTVLGNKAVALLHSAGAGDGGRSGFVEESPGLQVLTRGDQMNSTSTTGTYTDAESVAFAVKDALHRFTGTPSSGNHHYIGVWNESGPFFIGYDQSERPLFSNNLRVRRQVV